MAVQRQVLYLFGEYQKARICFAERVADLASQPSNIPALDNAGVLCLLQPLLTDVCPSVVHYAAIAIGRIANSSEKMANIIVQMDMIPIMLSRLEKQNKYYKKTLMYTLRAIARHSPQLAAAIISMGALETMMACMEEFDTNVKVAAVWAVGCTAKHTRGLAQACIDVGCIPLIILCLKEPELCLKQTACSTLAEIAKHGSELAQAVVDCSGSICLLTKTLHNQDAKLKYEVLGALNAIAMHNLNLAEDCVEAGIFPSVLLHIAQVSPQVSKAACALTRDIAKHSVNLAELIINHGGIVALLSAAGLARIPAFTAIGYISGQSEHLALAVAGTGAVSVLATCLEENDQYLQSAAAWALGQTGKHTAEHAKFLAEANVFRKLFNIYMDPNTPEPLKSKCKSVLKICIQKCTVLPAIESLVQDAPPEILKYVLGQYARILPHDSIERRLFLTTGGLRKIQEISAEPGSRLLEYILCINRCFPEEIVKFSSPGYPETLLDKVEQYKPVVCVPEKNRLTEPDEYVNDDINLDGDECSKKSGAF